MVSAFAGPAMARDRIRIVSAATVYPFAESAAEQFGKSAKYTKPDVENTGNGEAFRRFCGSEGDEKVDIAAVTRAMNKIEMALCNKHKINDFEEIHIGYHAVILIGNSKSPLADLTRRQVFMALAREVPDESGELQPNPYKSWKQIDAGLPDQPILIYGPPTNSALMETPKRLVLQSQCESFKEFTEAYADRQAWKNACEAIRPDNVYLQSDKPDDIKRSVSTGRDALGFINYRDYGGREALLRTIRIDGVEPTEATIRTGKYGISRMLFFYVKKSHLKQHPELAGFVHQLVSNEATGPGGSLIKLGLVPLGDAQRHALQDSVAKWADH
jgi:phosphate transport system substrate-binding protein